LHVRLVVGILLLEGHGDGRNVLGRLLSGESLAFACLRILDRRKGGLELCPWERLVHMLVDHLSREL